MKFALHLDRFEGPKRLNISTEAPGAMMGLEDWFGLSRWLRVVIALGVLAFPVYLIFVGVVWPWALAAGGVLLVLALLPPLGPQRTHGIRQRPPRDHF